MSNTTSKVITTQAGEALIAQMQAENKVLVIDKFVFANVANRPDFPQREDTVQTDDVVHESAVHEQGRLTENSVIYSTTLSSDVGPFTFNWSGLYCTEHNTLVAINYPPAIDKTVDGPGVTGNTLVRSFVLEYKGIAETTNITVDPESWQYNAHKRMGKMDNDTSQAIIDQNGKDWFIDDGFIVTPQSTAYNIKAGGGYVSGNRIALEFDRIVQVPNKPSFIYVDAWREGNPTGEWLTKFNFVVSADEKDDYTDAQGVKHFVCKIAQVLADGSASDLRSRSETTENLTALEQRLLTKPRFPPQGNAKERDVLPANVDIVSLLGQLCNVYPIYNQDREISRLEPGKITFSDGSFAYATPIKKTDRVIFNQDNTLQKNTDFTDHLINAMHQYAEVVIDGVEVWVSERIIPKTAKIRKLVIKNGGVLRLDDLALIYEVEGKSLLVDLREEGKIHCGLRKAQVARDHAPGETVIDVVDASELRIGDDLATSMMGDDGDGNKWANAIRSPGDSYNTIIAINGNQVTVSNPVGQRCLVKNTWLGNAKFGKGGLFFKGEDRSFVATILGGEIEETGAGYYISATTNIGGGVDPAYFFVRGTKFKGQFLDGFLFRGEEVYASFDEDWDVHKTYDIAKQSFIQDTGGDIELRNGKLRRGNYDVEFYPTGRKTNLGKIKMYNVECDGRSTLDITPEQINSITGKPLSETWSNLGDSLHVTQWSIDESRLNVKGFEANKCKFYNYRRSIVGTTFKGISQDLNILGDIKMTDTYMDCPPHFIQVKAGKTFYMSGDFQYNNLTINAKYIDPYYLLGYCGADIQIAPEPIYSGVTTLKTMPDTQQPNSCRVGTMQTLHCVGNSSGTSAYVRLTGPYNVGKIIAENTQVFKLESGQENYLTETIEMGGHGQFTGKNWKNRVEPIWTDSADTLNTDAGYIGTLQKKVYRKIEDIGNWERICKIASVNAPIASCELCIKPAKSYGGSGFIDAKFLLSLKPDNTSINAELVEQQSGIFYIGNNTVKAIAIGLIGVSNTGISDISEFKFRLTDQNVLEMNVGGTKDLAMLLTVKGNVIDV